ncbi:MAG: cbb3-type cytochrome oxidase assembly protein CcoS [Planctomycetota bacterium]
MDIIPLLVVFSLLLAALAVVFFVKTVRSGENEHADRLALLPLESDDSEPSSFSPTGDSSES